MYRASRNRSRHEVILPAPCGAISQVVRLADADGQSAAAQSGERDGVHWLQPCELMPRNSQSDQPLPVVISPDSCAVIEATDQMSRSSVHSPHFVTLIVLHRG